MMIDGLFRGARPAWQNRVGLVASVLALACGACSDDAAEGVASSLDAAGGNLDGGLADGAELEGAAPLDASGADALPDAPFADATHPGDAGSAKDSAPEGAACCPIETPSCNCFGIGGSAGPGGCPRICDAIPVSWAEGVDSNGCPVLVPKADAGSCITVPGPDL